MTDANMGAEKPHSEGPATRGEPNQAVPSDVIERYVKSIPQETLNIKTSKISDLNVKKGTHMFAFWFAVSTYLPIFTACICPLSNMMSIAALVTSWRSQQNGAHISDPKLVYILNAVSLGFGFLSNISVILNFGQIISYKVSQIVSITGFFIASMLLLTGVLLMDKRFMDHDFKYTEGFCSAVITLVFYFLCGISCFLNFLGYLLGKYSPDFNLEGSERGLIVYTFVLAVWLSWGAAMFHNLIDDTSYSNAIYFCVESLLTIGLGDIHPATDVAKALTLLYSFSGLTIIGLIVAMIRSMIVSSNTPVLFWNQLEMRRKRELKRLAGSNNALSHKQSFNLMRSIERDARRHQANLNTFMTVLIWVSFWLIGALVFHFTEDWKYFDAVYFCFLCFLTIGYGDYAPKSPAGRTFFIVWALAAVPLMTGLFSNIGERLYDLSNRGIRSRVFLKLFSRRSSTSNPFLHVFASRVKDMEDPIDENETEVIAEIISEASKTTFDSKADRTKTILNSMKRLVLGSIKDSSEKQKFEYEFWKSILEMRNYSLYDNTNSSRIEEKFWLSELSPLRLPISESNYLLYLLFKQLESELLGDSAEEESQRKKDE